MQLLERVVGPIRRRWRSPCCWGLAISCPMMSDGIFGKRCGAFVGDFRFERGHSGGFRLVLGASVQPPGPIDSMGNVTGGAALSGMTDASPPLVRAAILLGFSGFGQI